MPVLCELLVEPLFIVHVGGILAYLRLACVDIGDDHVIKAREDWLLSSGLPLPL